MNKRIQARPKITCLVCTLGDLSSAVACVVSLAHSGNLMLYLYKQCLPDTAYWLSSKADVALPVSLLS